MRLLIAGAGAIGQWLGARLADAHDVTLLARAPHVAAIRQRGVCVDDRFVKLGATTATTATFDGVILTCKAHATATLARQVAPLAARFVLCLQNGFGNAKKVAAATAPEKVAVALTSHGVESLGPGAVAHRGSGATIVGPHTDAAACTLATAVLDDAGLSPQRVDDITPHIWMKASVNAAINPLAAAHGLRNGALLDTKRASVEELADEVHSLARAAGIAMPTHPRDAALSTLTATRENRCSMLQDVNAHRPTEIEQITGRLVRLARRLGTPLFANEAIYHAVKAKEAEYLGEDVALAMTRQEVLWEDE